MTELEDQIKDHIQNRKYARITRQVSKHQILVNTGYIVGYSPTVVILQETNDFRVLGFSIFPLSQIRHIRYNLNDQYYDQIMSWEGEKKKLKTLNPKKINDWNSIFKFLQTKEKNVIVECEHPKYDSFTIGKVLKVTPKKVHIRYFDAQGYLDFNSTKIKFKNISKVIFDDRYIEVFSKYLREQKMEHKTDEEPQLK